jgi:hypothetical protein
MTLVPGADAERAEDDGERVGPVACTRRMPRAARGSKFLFERLHFGPEHVPAACSHARDGRVNVRRFLGHAEIHERDACAAHATVEGVGVCSSR